MRRVLFQSRLPGNGRERESVEAALGEYARSLSWDANSAELATLVHRASYSALGVSDPYAELKARSDEAALGLLGAAEGFIDSSGDRLAAAIRVSIAGNVMDFGSGIAMDDPDELAPAFEGLLAQGIEADETAEIGRLIEASETVLYLFDNCGESVFDGLLIREIRRMGKRVACVAKGAPILNDATVADIERIGIEADALLDTGGFAIGIDLRLAGPRLMGEIARAGVAVAKGMANLESLSDGGLGIPVAHLLRAKCAPVAHLLGVPVGANAAVVRRPETSFKYDV
jgi:uncharacterized protein with ATP-grasp and redox domains